MFPPDKKKTGMPPGPDPNDPGHTFGAGGPPPMGPQGPPMSGMVKPGRGMDPMAAMLMGLGPAMPPVAQGPPTGPNGLPVGGTMPGPADMDGVGGSPLLAALFGSAGQGPVLGGVGTGDPSMGLDVMLQMLALANAGVGGGPGSSGLDPGPMGNVGQMLGY